LENDFCNLSCATMKEKAFPSDATAFFFVQLGAHAADRFGERVARLQISPRQAGILRLIATTRGCNQQDLARRLGVLPSQMVLLIDELSKKRLVERRRSTEDRRVSFVRLTNKGERLMEKLSALVHEHGREFCSALTAKELRTLHYLCRKLADTHGLTPGVHPGYRKLFREQASMAGK
jgi:DNA-binding MarR family transcriptional regulator